MIKLIQFFPAWNLPNASPFCMKLETYLRMANLPYQNQYTANPRVSPTGKFPVITDSGLTIADSTLIIHHLKKAYGDTLDQHLSEKEHAVALAFQRLIEEHLYWVIVYSRWLDPTGWALTRSTYFAKLPVFLKCWLPGLLQKKVKRQIDGHGMGLHSPEKIYAFGQTDLKAIADFLDQKIFFMGDQPSSIDACVYGFLANILAVPIDSPLKDYAMTLPNLTQYCDRMRSAYFKPS